MSIELQPCLYRMTDDELRPCGNCNGTGDCRACVDWDWDADETHYCEHCEGVGGCPSCGGYGAFTKEERLARLQ